MISNFWSVSINLTWIEGTITTKSFGELARGNMHVICTHIMEYELKFMKRLVKSRIVCLSAIRVPREGYQVSVSPSRQNKAAKSFLYVYQTGLCRYRSGYSSIARLRGGGDGLFCSKIAPRYLSKDHFPTSSTELFVASSDTPTCQQVQ